MINRPKILNKGIEKHDEHPDESHGIETYPYTLGLVSIRLQGPGQHQSTKPPPLCLTIQSTPQNFSIYRHLVISTLESPTPQFPY